MLYIYIYIYVKTNIVQCASKNIDKTQKKALTRTTRFILQLVSSVKQNLQAKVIHLQRQFNFISVITRQFI